MLGSVAPTLYQESRHWTLVAPILCLLCLCTQSKARTPMQRWTGTIGKGGQMTDLTLQQILLFLLKHQNKNAAWIIVLVQIRVRAFHEEGPQLVKTEDQDIAISPSVGSDTTEGVHITTWEDLKLDLGRWYDLNNVSIHAYDCALTLLTTHSTKAVPAENRAKTPLAPALDEVTTTYKGEIIGAFATITHTCPQHHTLFKVNPELKNALCAPCEMHYKNTKLSIKCEAIITVELSDSSKKVWKFANGCLAKVVPPRLWTTKEDVIQHLLDLNMVDFKVRNNEIISCSPCPITRVTTAL